MTRTNNRFSRRLRPSPALVVAAIALLASTAGVSYAAVQVTGANVKNSSLTGRDLKNATVTSKDVKDRSLLARDFKRGQLRTGPTGPQGAQGQQGAAGPAGPKGDKGEKGDPGVAGRHIVVQDAIGSTASLSATATCPAGEHVLGGGANSNASTTAAITRSNPTGDGTSWEVTVNRGAAGNEWQVFARAICAQVP